MKDFNLKKYLANNPLLKEEINDELDNEYGHATTSVSEDRFEDVEHIFSGEDDPKLIQWREDRDDLMTQAEVGIDDLLTSLHDQAYELGFDTNGPAIWHDIKELIKDKLWTILTYVNTYQTILY